MEYYQSLHRYQQELFKPAIEGIIANWKNELEETGQYKLHKHRIDSINSLWDTFIQFEALLDQKLAVTFNKNGLAQIEIRPVAKAQILSEMDKLKEGFGVPIIANSPEFLTKELLIDKLEIKEYYLEQFRVSLLARFSEYPPQDIFFINEYSLVSQARPIPLKQ